jgi:hypothetical protein
MHTTPAFSITGAVCTAVSVCALLSLLPQEPSAPQAQATESSENDPGSTLFGFSVCALGDLDGDSFEDFAVGAPVAYTDGGRTGSVLIFSGKLGTVLQRFDGKAPYDWFGWSLTAVDDLDGDGACDLAIGTSPDYFEKEEQQYVRFVSPQKGSLIATFDGACRCLGRFEDRDADGVRDLLMGSGWPKYSYSWISSKDCHRIGESPAPKEYYVVPIGDLNGDGNIDFASHVGSEPSRVKITSGRDGSELWTWESARSAEGVSGGEFRSAAIDANHDGVLDVIVNSSEIFKRRGRLTMLSGRDHSCLYEILLDDFGDTNAYVGECHYSFHALPDLDGDDHSDFAVGSSEFLCRTRLQVFSGRTGTKLWERPRLESEEQDAAVCGVLDRDGDGVAEILHGSVFFIFDGPQWGENGSVEILSGKTANRLRVIAEYDVYDQIGPPSARHPKK